MTIPEDKSDESQLDCRRKNFFVLVVYNVILRTGWIFKTENIIMPAILDLIGGGGWLRGWLPMLNRIGQSVPPILVSDWIRQRSRKKHIMVACTTIMGVCFLMLALVWARIGEGQPSWLPIFFLFVYGSFWLSVGIHNLCLSLLYGKLVEVEARGKLMLVAMSIGSVSAIGTAYVYMGKWLAGGNSTFVWLFLFTGASFVFAACWAALLTEEPDIADETSQSLRGTIADVWSLIRVDANFRILAAIAACFGMGVTLMPHYQAYVKVSFEISLADFVPWVIAQNMGAAFFSMPLGRLADRFGNRLAMQLVMLFLCFAPTLTILLVNFGGEFTRLGFYIVFFMLGLMPVSMRLFNNYTLEIAGRDQQPIYLSTLGLAMAAPVVGMSILVGWLMDVASFQTVFLIILTILLAGWILTFRLAEPRSQDRGDSAKSQGITLT